MNKDVLIVDRDEAVHRETGDALRSEGLSFDSAFSASSARRLLDERHYSTILLDFRCLDAQLLESFERGADFAFRVVLVTGCSAGDVRHLDPARVSALLRKPLDTGELAELIAFWSGRQRHASVALLAGDGAGESSAS